MKEATLEKFMNMGPQGNLNTGVETAMAIGALASAGTAIYSATNQPKIPKPPKQADIISAPQDAVAGKTLEEDTTSKVNARKTARKGTKALRIPLQAKSTGVATSGGSGLNI